MLNMKKTFKDIFNQILRDYNLSQHKVANKIGVSQSTISRWLAGIQEPSFTIIQKICNVFDIDGNEMLGLD